MATKTHRQSPNITSAGEHHRGPTRDILALIIGLEPQMTKASRKIAQAILRNPRHFVETPVEELVPWLGVSAPTITRFARSLGCDGLRQLKLQIMGSMRVGRRYLEPLHLPNGIVEVVDRVVQKAQTSISNAQSAVDMEQAERAIRTVSTCHRLYAFGSGGVSSWMIEEVQNRLFRLGITVIPCADNQMQLMMAATMGPGDVIIGFSLTGQNEELVRTMSIAQAYGATVIGVSTRDSAVAAAADLPFIVNALDDREVLGPTSMRYAFLMTIDIIAFGVGIELQKPARETLRRIKQQFTSYHNSDDTLPLCD